MFNFDNTFEIHDDIEVLKRMGMAFGLEKNRCGADDLRRAVKMIPKSLEPYVLGEMLFCLVCHPESSNCSCPVAVVCSLCWY